MNIICIDLKHSRLTIAMPRKPRRQITHNRACFGRPQSLDGGLFRRINYQESIMSKPGSRQNVSDNKLSKAGFPQFRPKMSKPALFLHCFSDCPSNHYISTSRATSSSNHHQEWTNNREHYFQRVSNSINVVWKNPKPFILSGRSQKRLFSIVCSSILHAMVGRVCGPRRWNVVIKKATRKTSEKAMLVLTIVVEIWGTLLSTI